MSIMACCSCLRANSRFPAVVPGILSRAAAAAGCGRSHRSFSYFEETSSESIELSVEQMVAIAEIANIILKHAEPPHQQFGAIKDNDDGHAIGTRWQNMTEVLFNVQLMSALSFGFKPDPSGFQHMTAAMQKAGSTLTPDSPKALEYAGLMSKMMDIAVERSFGTHARPDQLDLLQARKLILQVTTQMQSENFLDKVDALKALPMEQKSKRLEDLLVPIYKEAMADYGFYDDMGYVQMKATLMPYMADPQIQMNYNAASFGILQRGGFQDS